MAWIDDRFWAHPKVVGLPDKAFRVAVNAILYSHGFGLYGRLERQHLAALGVTPGVRAKLLEVGLWEEEDGAILIHDWDEHNSKHDDRIERERSSGRRRKDLYRNPELRLRIRERDGDACRYCGQTVNWSDRKGALAGTYDHVDPNGGNSLENVVVACRLCNTTKGCRTPDEAGTPLLAIKPGSSPDQAQNLDPDLDPDLDPNQAPNQALACAGPRPMTNDRVTTNPEGSLLSDPTAAPAPEPELPPEARERDQAAANGAGAAAGGLSERDIDAMLHEAQQRQRDQALLERTLDRVEPHAELPKAP